MDIKKNSLVILENDTAITTSLKIADAKGEKRPMYQITL